MESPPPPMTTTLGEVVKFSNPESAEPRARDLRRIVASTAAVLDASYATIDLQSISADDLQRVRDERKNPKNFHINQFYNSSNRMLSFAVSNRKQDTVTVYCHKGEWLRVLAAMDKVQSIENSLRLMDWSRRAKPAELDSLLIFFMLCTLLSIAVTRMDSEVWASHYGVGRVRPVKEHVHDQVRSCLWAQWIFERAAKCCEIQAKCLGRIGWNREAVKRLRDTFGDWYAEAIAPAWVNCDETRRCLERCEDEVRREVMRREEVREEVVRRENMRRGAMRLRKHQEFHRYQHPIPWL